MRTMNKKMAEKKKTAKIAKGFFIVCRGQTLMNSKIFWLDIARCPRRDEIHEQEYH
jgi:hypothetical protein